MQTYAIVGAGVTGTGAAEALRGAGFDGRIVLLGDEPDPPYQRPPLSKDLLRGTSTSDAAALRAPAFYTSNAIELRLSDRVERIDLETRRLTCASGEAVTYDKLLIATGGSPRRLRVPGSDLQGIHYLRTLRQAEALRDALIRRPRVLVVGSGFIGCEVAASARQLGCDVTIVGPTLPMERALGPEVGRAYGDYHRGNGVTLRIGVTVDGFRGTHALEEAVLSDGTRVPCDVAIVGIGIVLDSALLPALIAPDGITTDALCRTEAENVFAAGDIARSWRPRLDRYVRMEHFDNAELQGAAAARSMCGATDPYDPIPFFWSDQYEFDLQYYGHAEQWDRAVVRGKPKDGNFEVFYIRDDTTQAALCVNRSRDVSLLKRLLGTSGISLAALQDDGTALKTLLKT